MRIGRKTLTHSRGADSGLWASIALNRTTSWRCNLAIHGCGCGAAVRLRPPARLQSRLEMRLAIHDNGRARRAPMEPEEQEPKYFSLSEAERARREVEPLLIDAMEGRRRMADLEEGLSGISNRIQIMGGVTVDYDVAARMRSDLNRVVAKVK